MRRAPKEIVKLWSVDTGCGSDLVGKSEVRTISRLFRQADSPMVFNTANGSTAASQVVPIPLDELEEIVEPFVLGNTPAVVSVG